MWLQHTVGHNESLRALPLNVSPCNLIFKKSIIMVKQWSGTTLFVSGLGLKYTVHIYMHLFKPFPLAALPLPCQSCKKEHAESTWLVK